MGHKASKGRRVEEAPDTPVEVPQKVRKDWALFYAARDGNHEEVERLLDEGANPNWLVLDFSWRTAFHVAASMGHHEVVRTLLARGAELEKGDANGRTALHHAYRRPTVVRVLIEAGANVHAKNMDGSTPLHYSRNKEVVEALVEGGAHVTATDKNGWTPLHTICSGYGADEGTAEALVAAGADVHARDKDGNTALHVAAKRTGRLHLIDELVAAGADLDCTNNDGKTPRDVATPEARIALDRARLAQQFELQVPPDRVMLMFCGNGMVGKTTLTKALEHGKAHSVNGRTYGFDSFGAVIPHADKCTMVDFGGQPEFWVPHGVFLGNRSGVYLVVINLGDPPSTQRSQLRHWLRFIVSRSKRGTRPQVAVVGSHRGAAASMDSTLKEKSHRMTTDEQEALIARIKQLESITSVRGRRVSATLSDTTRRFHDEFTKVLDIASSPFLIESVTPDAMDTDELIRLQQWLGTAFSHIRETRKVPQVCVKVAELVATHLRPALPPITTHSAVMAVLKEAAGDSIDFSDDARNRAILSHLWEAGHLMVFEGVGDTVVVDPQAFGTHVIGQLFCPHGDPDFDSLVVNEKDGYVFRQSQLETHLSHVRESGCDFGDAQHALRLLTALELIIPLPTTPDTVDDPVFTIPGRLNQGDAVLEEYCRRPSECWSEPRQFDGWLYLGVRLKLASPLSLIPPSEFPRLQHRLSGMTGFRMWRHGMCMSDCTPDGDVDVEGLVELNDALEHIDVCVRSETGNTKRCATLLENLVEASARVSDDFACATLVRESLRKHVDADRQTVPTPAAQSRLSPAEWLRANHCVEKPGGDGGAPPIGMDDTVGPLAPDVLISYSTKLDVGCADDERGKQLTLHIASLLDTHSISCYHGLMVPPGEVWWHHWFGRVAGCKVAIVVLSPAYFASAQCIRELNALLEHKKELRIIPVVAAAGVAEVLRGDFLGTTESGQLQAAGIRALLRTNWLPPPDEAGGVYRIESPENEALLIETVQAKLRVLPS